MTEFCGVRAAFAWSACWASAAGAQQPVTVAPPPPAATEVLAPRPDIAVEWPDLGAGATSAAAAAAEAPATRYAVTVTGLEPAQLDAFRAGSALWKARGDPANLAQLNRRAADDRDLIDQLLRAAGFYGAATAVAITRGPPVRVTLTVDPGPVYTFDQVTAALPPGVSGFAIKPGDPVAATAVDAAEDGLRLALGRGGYPFAVVDPPAITIDHASRTADLIQRIEPGPQGRFGRLRVTGRSLLTAREVDRLARFRSGDPYDAARLDDLRRALIATGLLGGVTLTPVRNGVDADGRAVIDVDVKTETAPLRTVAATAGYSTSQGIRVEASWQHRNLLPPNGAVTVRAIAAEREQLIGTELRRQNWRSRDTTLTLGVTARNATQDAFTARTLTFGATMERETNLIWQKRWYYTIGPETLLSRERDKSEPGDPLRTYYIAALPGSLTYDGSDNLLDPTRGFRLTGRASPELSFQSGTFGYVRLQVEGSTYVPVSDRITFAVRGHLGSIAGAARRNIAPTRRFYAGGGGSVRGFGFQQVGPQDADGDPRGGNSVTEASVEARFRFGDFGVVPFIDTGQVFTSTIPNFDSLRVGAGIGARYYTSFGPVRIDLATPVNPRKGDARVQFYVSIGQAF